MALGEDKIFMNELEMAKKRDHKIMITDEAIKGTFSIASSVIMIL